MLATIKHLPGQSRAYNNPSLYAANLVKHFDSCQRGCGRNLEGRPWPPP